jgi:hypothetical protein
MPGRGRYWKEGGLKDSIITSADIKNATITAADIKISVSDLQTGNGSAQAYAHGLGVAPTKVICCVYQDANESTPTTVTEGSITANNVSHTVTSGAKYKVLVIA